jgi:thimet oligopeptidase
MKRIEYAPKDFAWTQWTPEEIAEVAEKVVAEKKAAYEKVKAVPAEERTFENTVYAVEAAGHGVDRLFKAAFLMNVSPSKEVRDAAQRAIERAEKELVDVEYDEDVYRAVKEYEAKGEKLEGEDAKLFQDMLREYRRMGFDLPEGERAKLKDNLKRLSELANEFEKNINEYKDHIEVTREELDGLPETYIASLRKNEAGKYLVTLDYPDYFPFMENAHDAAKREELADKNLRKGGERNAELLREMVRLRDENAKLLGYPNHGEFRLEVKMAKKAENVFRFIHDLTDRLADEIVRETEELRAFKRKITGDEMSEAHYYDVAYLGSQLKKEKFSVDNEKVREYFPLEKVKDGVLRIYSELLSVRFERLDGYPLWHEDVELYVVKDADGGTLSYFMLDLYPRDGKYGHAAEFTLVSGHRSPEGNAYVSPVVSLVMNLPKPSAQNPSLMSHHEVEVFFHEFGHVMHDVLTKAKYASQAGTSVSRDFVEAPSQMLENWVWDKEILGMISGHYRTGERLPEEVLDNMVKAKNHGVAYATMRQMAMALFDMTVHTHGVQGELNEEFGEMFAKYTCVRLPQGQMFLAGWGHIAGGYDVGYYGYMWSKVYSSDMFTRFKKEGLLNKKTGMDYRQWILEKGSSMEEMDLVRGFLGRDPNNEAFLEEIGLEA